MMRLFFALGCVSALLAVAAGAFAAHGLEQRLEPRWVEIFKTGAQYQMYHALALIAVAWAMTVFPGKGVPLAGWFFVAGTLLFSGSLYALALTQIRWLGAITPFGGVSFLVGWALLVWAALARGA